MNLQNTTTLSTEQEPPAIVNPLLSAVPSVCLVWGSRKRHIAFDRKLLCETNHKGGYSKGGHYCSYDLDTGVFEKMREVADVNYSKGRGGSHTDGIIPFKPLNEVEPIIFERSICKQCLKRYNRELARHGR